MNHIILIGLPSAGKSTMGVILAKTLGLRFIDTDILIQEQTGRLLQNIIDKDGSEEFLKIEEETLLSLNIFPAVIATGGSAVYSMKAMEHLKCDNIIVYLYITYEEMLQRLNNIKTRGIVKVPGQSLLELYNQRIPLYETYADIRVDCSKGNFELIVETVIDKILTYSSRRER